MANYLEAAQGDSVPLTFNNILNDGTISVTAKIYDVDDTQIGTTKTLAHVADGLYTFKYTVDDPGSNSDILTIIVIPSGDDNSTVIDQIKVRLLSPFGHGGGATGADGINDDDIKKIIKELKKELPKPEENVLGFLEELLDKKLKTINFKPNIKVETPRVTVKPTPVTIKAPDVNIKAPIVNPTPVTVTPTPIVVNPTPVTVKPVINPAPVNIDLDKIQLELSKISQSALKPENLVSIQGKISELIKNLESNKELIFQFDELETERLSFFLKEMTKLFEQVFTEIRFNKDAKGIQNGFETLSKALQLKNDGIF